MSKVTADATQTSERKRDHLEVAASEESQSGISPGWDDVNLVHQPVPAGTLEETGMETTFLGHRLAAPLVIASMTGGHAAARDINARLGQAAEQLGIAVGVGSQRAALEDPSLAATYRVLREHAPTAVVIANLGVCQLVPQADTPGFTVEMIRRAVEMVEADALAIHLNIVEEMIQTEGDRNTAGLLDALGNVVEQVDVPVLAKETGSGMSREVARALTEVGVAAIDVGGAGGTSFARVEGVRARRSGDERGARLGETFADWGIPTAASILETRDLDVQIVATGGVRNGLHVAKAIALGADVVGMGRPALQAAMDGLDPLLNELRLIIEELRVATLLAGGSHPTDLRERRYVLRGATLQWMKQRGLEDG